MANPQSCFEYMDRLRPLDNRSGTTHVMARSSTGDPTFNNDSTRTTTLMDLQRLTGYQSHVLGELTVTDAAAVACGLASAGESSTDG